MKYQVFNTSSQVGFTMVEVLVTIVVMAIGLLGLASMQTTSLKGNHNAYLRGQAVLLVNDIADRVRANQVAADANAYAAVTTTGSTPGKNCLDSSTCSTAELAVYDAWAWRNSVAAVMTQGSGTLQCRDDADTGYADIDSNGINDADTDGDTCTDGSSYLATIQWNENESGGNATHTLTMEVVP